MVTIAPLARIARDGRPFTLRAADEADVTGWTDLIRALDAPDALFASEPDERDLDPGRRREIVRTRRAHPADLLLVAAEGDRVVGYVDVLSFRPRRMAHAAWLHMGVLLERRQQGIGTALLESVLDWARAHPAIEKVCLGVFASNVAALALYRRLGFEEEGRCLRTFRLGTDRYVDDVEMYRFVK